MRTSLNIVKVDIDVIISVRPHVLMKEAERVQELVNDGAVGRNTCWCKAHLLLATDHTHIGRATERR